MRFPATYIGTIGHCIGFRNQLIFFVAHFGGTDICGVIGFFSLGRYTMQWSLYSFAQLDSATLYELLRLRVDVFVVEQHCPYPELDGKDTSAKHLLGFDDAGKLQAYARLLPPGCSYAECSIGRVLVAKEARGHGFAWELMQRAIAHCHELWPSRPIRIGAQDYLRQFYVALGFIAVSDVYLEDDIPHLEMLLPSL